MTLKFDYKTNGLIVETPLSDLRQQAQQLCAVHGQQDLMQKDIGHITYLAPIELKTQKTHMLRWGLLGGITMIVSWAIFSLGVWKLIELILQR